MEKLEDKDKSVEEVLISNHDEDQNTEDHFSTFDDLMNWLGGRGRYSVSVLICTFFLVMYPGFSAFTHNFTAAIPDFWCNLNSSDLNFNSSETEDDCTTTVSKDQCFIITNCTKALVPYTRLLACDSWTYDKSIYIWTIVSRFNLVCQNAIYAKTPCTAYFAGFMAGCSFFGLLSDKIGRQKSELCALITIMVTTFLAAVIPWYWLYVPCQFFSGMGGGGVVTTNFTMTLESTTAKHRVTWALLTTNGWAMGTLLLALVAYINSDYQVIHTALGIGVIISFPIIIYMGESTRWEVTTRKYKIATKSIKKMAKMNKKQLPENFKANQLHTADKQQKSKASFIDLFRTPGIRKLTLITWILFATVSLTYYGISLAVGSIGGNVYRNQIYSSLVEIPARIFAVFLSMKLSRRLELQLTFSMAGLSLVISAILFNYEHLTPWRVGLAMHGKFWITIAYDFVFIYVGEAFPTVLRSAAVGSGSTMAHIGAMSSTLISLLGRFWLPLPFAILGIGPFLACSLAFFLPETSGCKLPESIEDGEKFASTKLSFKKIKTEDQIIINTSSQNENKEEPLLQTV